MKLIIDMKKYSVIMLSLSIGFLHSMEQPIVVKLSVNSTEIQVRKGSIVDADRMVDIIVLGRSGQHKLQESSGLGDSANIGVFYDAQKLIYVKNHDDDSGSDDDTYHYYDPNCRNEKNVTQKKMSTTVSLIVEPRIMQKQYYDTDKGCLVKGYWYCVEKDDPQDDTVSYKTDKKGEEAIKAASDDLRELCYKKILTTGVQKKYKRIAIDALSTNVGFPRYEAALITVSTVWDFIQTNSEYQRIMLYVKKRSELELYQKLFFKKFAEYVLPKK